jgi:hypothetical protein
VGSDHAVDWFEVDFGVERPVESLVLYFIDEGDSIVPPTRYDVEAWSGDRWVDLAGNRSPREPAGRRANRLTLSPVHASRVRVRFTHRPGAATGLSEIEVWGHAALPLPEPAARRRNLAAGATATASFSAAGDRVEHLTDMQIGFTRYARNRWSARGSPNARDWVAIDLGSVQTIAAIDLYLYGDRGLAAPTAYAVEIWNGRDWVPVGEQRRRPTQPTAWAMNRVVFDRVDTDRMRVVFDHALPSFTGVTEIMLWERAP